LHGVQGVPSSNLGAPTNSECSMTILRVLGVAVLVTWLVLWLAVKVTFAAIHLLFLLGIALIVVSLVKKAAR
jgi:hypothetical protein